MQVPAVRHGGGSGQQSKNLLANRALVMASSQCLIPRLQDVHKMLGTMVEPMSSSST